MGHLFLDFIGFRSPARNQGDTDAVFLALGQFSNKAPEVLWLAVSTRINAPSTRDCR